MAWSPATGPPLTMSEKVRLRPTQACKWSISLDALIVFLPGVSFSRSPEPAPQGEAAEGGILPKHSIGYRNAA
ncbi:MAG: hypothetical protein KDJ25_12625, partial [Rhodoblastus sp.]|nr:hypothetical protein [Rhodoblastus sp.]